MIYRFVSVYMIGFFNRTVFLRLQRRMRIPPIKALALVAIIAGATVIAGISIGYYLYSPHNLRQFSTYQQLANFIQTSRPPALFYGWEMGPTLASGGPPGAMANTFSGTAGYSSTNVQVQGVDEPDVIKTDGTYIYTLGEDKVSIIHAYPTDTAKVIANIDPIGNPVKLFLYNSAYLVVISGIWKENWLEIEDYWNDYNLHYIDTVAIEIFNVTAPWEISRSYWITFDGSYLGARLIDQYLYFLGNCETRENNTIVLPNLIVNGQKGVIPANEIYYDPGNRDYSFQYTVLLGLDITDSDAEPSIETLLGGSSSATLYASLNNIYLAISQYAAWTSPSQESTTAIHRFSINEGEIEYQASGEVAGHLINQFALDEFAGFLRVATESIVYSPTLALNPYPTLPMIQVSRSQSSSVFVLDLRMKVVGSLRGLAPGEQIYSTRFLGTTCYLVTFYKTDPLFVIDLTHPSNPQLQGELIIPGYSDYLHPLGDHQLLGIGKDVAVSSSEEWWWYQGLKLSLFNTSDPFHPKEATNLIIGVRGTTSPALDDHKAVLVDVARHLLVLPILLAEYPENTTHEPWEHGDYVYQGAYIFDLDPSNATIDIRGCITHIENASILANYHWGDRPYFIQRTLYINDILYALSPYKLTFHTLDGLEFQGEIILSSELNTGE